MDNTNYTDEQLTHITDVLKTQLIKPDYDNWKWDDEFKIMVELSIKKGKKYDEVRNICRTLLTTYFEKCQSNL